MIGGDAARLGAGEKRAPRGSCGINEHWCEEET